MLDIIELRYFLNSYPEDDIIVMSFYNAAIEYLKGAGIKQHNSELYKLAVKMLVSHWFDNRGINGETTEIPYGITPIINQLQLKVINDEG